MAGANRGKRKAEVHPAFAKRAKDLRNQAKEQVTAYAGSGTRPWQTPREVTEQVNNPPTQGHIPHPVDQGGALLTDLLAIATLHQQAFDRPYMNLNYLDCMKSAKEPGTVGDVQSLKYQIDYNATEERAFRVRHMTPCRAIAHSMARRNGHGGAGRTFENVEKQAADLILSGATTPVEGKPSKPTAA